ncbi:Uncharacterised protein [Legionella busanensis]|uniref:Uncharacterized protein n=1 Tax=Legionella busanensis TaxID=190655 RepID=A0A378JGA2_9GAMM|nr:hypothetical protein [Legionella busanensis]STX50205.1 Uncharacterised protein [Legionella busanensis]
MKTLIKKKEINRYNNKQNLPEEFEGLIINNYSSYLKNDEVNWNNIAVLILQDLEKKGVKVADKIIEKINSNTSYNDFILQYIIKQLYSYPNYHLFLEKFAFKLGATKDRVISLTVLKEAGITDIKELEKIFKEFLLEQKKLAKNAPNLVKIKDEDDFEQLISLLAANPLYENLLHAFLQQLINEFNKYPEEGIGSVTTEVLEAKSLQQFFQSLSIDITLQPPKDGQYRKGTLYASLDSTNLNYTVCKNNGELVRGVIPLSGINGKFNDQTTEEELKKYLPNILKITTARRHTSQLALSSTLSLAEALLQFIQTLSIDATLQPPNNGYYRKDMLYVTLNYGYLNYSVLKDNGELVSDTIRFSELSNQIDEQTTEEELKQYLPNILKITAARGHTTRLALNNTASLRDRAIDFIKKEFNPELHSTNLPSSCFIQREEAKFLLDQWLNAGNLPQVISHLIDDSYLRCIQQLDHVTAQAKNHSEMSTYIKAEIDAVRDLMDNFIHLAGAMDKQDSAFDIQILQLISHLKNLKNFYDKTPLLFSNEVFPKTDGNFNEFVKNIILQGRKDELIEFSNNQDEIWCLKWDSLINALVENSPVVKVFNKKTSKSASLTDESGHLIPAKVIFREELKMSLLTHLKENCLHYHRQALQNYQKEQAAKPAVQTDVDDFTKQLSIPTKPFKLPTITLEEARTEAYRQYSMRHILTLKSYKAWTNKEKYLQQVHNRILQPNFMEGLLDEQLRYAQIAQEEWLTDVLVPKFSTALYLNIAARLITDYRVDIEAINQIAQQLWHKILSSNISDKLMMDWQEISIKMAPLAETETTHYYKDCQEKAKLRMSQLYPTVAEDTSEYEFKFKSCLEMEKNKVRKKLSNQVMAAFLDRYFDQFASQEDLHKKPQFTIGENKDYVFIGPAASGKSTISNQYIHQDQRLDYVSMATDDYRGIRLPGTDDFEGQQTDQMFIRTQDSAYLVSEIVEDRMRSLKDKRPNMIVDGVTYKPAHRALVETNKNSVIVCACLDDASEVVNRSYNRAIQEDSSSADKGRHVNTSSLLHMHKTASISLIKYCQPNSNIDVYNTNIRRGETPPLIATINTHGVKNLIIHDEKDALSHLTSFFNKNRLNVSARNASGLFIAQLQKPMFQIESLFTVLDHDFNIVLKDKDGNAYLTFRKNGKDSIEMTIPNPEQVKEKLSHPGRECELLKMMLLYGQYGCLKEVRKQCLIQETDRLVEDILSKAIAANQYVGISNQMV